MVDICDLLGLGCRTDKSNIRDRISYHRQKNTSVLFCSLEAKYRHFVRKEYAEAHSGTKALGFVGLYYDGNTALGGV